MHKGIIVGLCMLLLGACAQWPPQQNEAPPAPEKEVAVPVVIEVPPPEIMQQLSELVLHGQRVSRLDAGQQKRELAAAQKAYGADKDDLYARLRLGMLLSLPGTAIQDDARALAMLEPYADAPAGASVLRQFGALLHANVAERAKAQKRVGQLKDQLEALRAVERSIIERGLESQPRKP